MNQHEAQEMVVQAERALKTQERQYAEVIAIRERFRSARAGADTAVANTRHEGLHLPERIALGPLEYEQRLANLEAAFIAWMAIASQEQLLPDMRAYVQTMKQASRG